MADFSVTSIDGQIIATSEIRDLAIISALAEMKLIDPMKVHSFANGILAEINRRSKLMPEDRAALARHNSDFKAALLQMKEHPATVGHPNGEHWGDRGDNWGRST
ncbi:MAG: hypothetical protein WBD95_27070 [Xanthobacteraceae bacterium]